MVLARRSRPCKTQAHHRSDGFAGPPLALPVPPFVEEDDLETFRGVLRGWIKEVRVRHEAQDGEPEEGRVREVLAEVKGERHAEGDGMTDSGRDHSGLVEEAREWKARSEAVLPVLEMLPDATVKQVATYMRQAVEHVARLSDALSASLERERELRQEKERLRWYYENMRYVDRANLEMEYEAALAKLPDGEGEIVAGSGRRGKPRRMDHMVSVRLGGDLIRRLRGIANKRGTTLSDLLREGAVMVAEANNPSARPNDEGDGR